MTQLINGILIAFILAIAAQTLSADEAHEGPAITVYSSADPAGFDPQQFIAQQRVGENPNFVWQVPGFGVIKETRSVDLKPGVSSLRFPDVARFIDPTTVSFSDLSDKDPAAVLEQNFEFDLAGPDKILEKYLDRKIEVVLAQEGQNEVVSGTLLSSAGGQLVIQTEQGLRVISSHGQQIKLAELPGGLITRPTLVWKVQSNDGGQRSVRTTYQTGGMTWRSDYNLVLNQDETKADVSAWVSLMNLCGAAFKDARLKLIAGDVQRIQPQPQTFGGLPRAAMMEKSAGNLGFEEKSFFEYHLYTLPRRTDIASNGTQQITLFPTAKDVGVEKLMVYYGLPDAAHWGFFGAPQQDRSFGSQSNPKVDVYLRFKNSKENKMGMPLPKGKVRVYKQDDADGTLEFIGEDLIDHTPKDEKVLVKLGQAFDVVGERTQTSFTIDTNRKTMTESFRIQIRNHKAAAQKVIIKENLYRWTQWEIAESSTKYDKIDSRTIHFEVEVPADGVRTVTYTVKYTW